MRIAARPRGSLKMRIAIPTMMATVPTTSRPYGVPAQWQMLATSSGVAFAGIMGQLHALDWPMTQYTMNATKPEAIQPIPAIKMSFIITSSQHAHPYKKVDN